MKTHAEAPIEADTFANIEGAAEEGAAALGVSLEDDPAAIVDAIDAFVFKWQCGVRPKKKVITPDDAPFAMGSLWGQQLVRAFDWEWAMVTFHEHDDATAPAVLSPDRSLAVYPIHFAIGCMRDAGVDATIMLSFNMLKADKVGELEQGEYMNLMEGVHRIVPRIATPVKKPWWKFW